MNHALPWDDLAVARITTMNRPLTLDDLVLAGIALAAGLVLAFLSRTVLLWLAKHAKRTRWTGDDIIVDALRSDIESGRLHRGEQLPTHRALALALDVDLTTVTRAYREARDEGLTEARVGQGTFVAESLAQSPRRLARM